MKDPIILRG